MKNTLRACCYLNPVLLLMTLLISMNGQAEKIKVKKVKGNNAIVESLTPLEEGQVYEIETESISQDVDYKSSIQRSRQNSLTLGGQFEFLKSSTLENTNFSIQGRYGWNYSNLEIGALLNLDATDQGAGATSTVLAGGYFDYNLVPNHNPKKLIYGAFALAAFGSTQYPSAAAGGSSTNVEADAGGFLTYFIGTTSTALRGEAYLKYEQINTTAQQNGLFGFGVRGLLLFYF